MSRKPYGETTCISQYDDAGISAGGQLLHLECSCFSRKPQMALRESFGRRILRGFICSGNNVNRMFFAISDLCGWSDSFIVDMALWYFSGKHINNSRGSGVSIGALRRSVMSFMVIDQHRIQFYKTKNDKHVIVSIRQLCSRLFSLCGIFVLMLVRIVTYM